MEKVKDFTKKVNLQKEIVDISGNVEKNWELARSEKGYPIVVNINADGNSSLKIVEKGSITVKILLVKALNSTFKDDKPTAEVLLERGLLIRKINSEDDSINLEDKEIEIIKKLLPEAVPSPYQYLQVYEELF